MSISVIIYEGHGTMALMESIFELEGLDWGRSRIEDALVIEKSHYQAPNKLIELEKIAVHITGDEMDRSSYDKATYKGVGAILSQPC